MAMNRLKANICGTTYTLVSEETLSYMRDLVAQVDAEMTEIVSNDSRMSTTMAAVLTAVQNADKARKESRAAEELRLKLKHVVDDSEHLRDQLASARAEIARLSEENTRLRRGVSPSASLSAKPASPAAKPAPPVPPADPWVTDFEEIIYESEDL